MRRHAHGFTLIELMIVMSVIAVLASLAYPSYGRYVRIAHRSQAKADLIELAQLAERYYTVHSSYQGFDLPFAASPRDGVARYTLTLDGQGATTYTLKATPISAQASDNCGTLTLNQAGIKTPAPRDVGCW